MATLSSAWQELDLLLTEFPAEWRKEKQDILEQAMREGRLRIAVLGRFKAGKSTLINALIGQELLPADALPATAVVCEIEAGEPEGYLSEQAGQVTAIDRRQFQHYATGKFQGQGDLTVLRATLPGIPLPARVCLADTPGVDALNEDHAKVAYGYLPQVDAALYVLRATQGGLSQGDLEYLQRGTLSSTRQHMLFVLTHIDQVPESQLSKIQDAVQTHLQEIDISNPVILPIDSHNTRSAQNVQEQDPQLGALWQALKTHHLDQADALRQRRAWRTWHDILLESQHQLEIQRQGLGFDDAELRREIENFHEAQRQLRDQRHILERHVHQLQQKLLEDLGIQVRERLQLVANHAATEVRNRAQGQKKSSAQQLAAEIRNDLAEQMSQLVEDWLRPELERVQKEIQGEVKRMTLELPSLQQVRIEVAGNGWRDHLLDIVSQVLVFGVLDLLLPGGAVAALIARVLGQKVFGKTAEAITNVLARVINVTSVEMLGKQISSSITDKDVEILQQFRNQLEPLLAEMAKQSLGQVDAQINDTRASLEKARESQQAGERNVASEQRRLEQLIGQLSRLDAVHKPAWQ